jgi:hypothetical protein
MRRSRSSALPLLAALAAAAPLAAQTVEGGTFLLLPVGARATALGQAAIADGGTTEALYWNPAGLAAVRRGEAAIHHYTAFFGSGDALTIAAPIPGIGVIGFGAYLVNYGDLDVTPPGGGGSIPIGRLSPRNVALIVGFATDLGPVSAGLDYKLVQFRADCSGDCTNVPSAVGTTHAVDIGVQAALLGSPLVVAAAVRNLGFPLQVNNQAQADPLPTRVVIGVKWPVLRPPGQADALDLTILADLETAVQGEFEPAPLLGLESGVRDVVRLRVGYAFVDAAARGPSLGLGIHVGRLGVDLARTFYATDAIGEKEPIHISLRLAL